MHRTSQMILRLRLSSARVGRESSRVLLGPGGSRYFTVPYSSTVRGDSRPLKGQHNFVHGVAKRSSSAYEAAASDESVPSNDSSAPLAAAEVAADPAPLPSPPQDQSGGVGEGSKFAEVEGSSPHPSTPIDSTMLVVPSPNGGAPVKMSMPQSTAEAIAMSKAMHEKAVLSAQVPPSRDTTTVGANESGTHVAFASNNEMETPRTLLLRTPDSYPVKVTVPRTTAEAVALNRSIQEKTRQEVVASERTPKEAELAGSPDIEEGGAMTETKVETTKVEQTKTPKEMVVTPTARSKSLKIPVPATTAEAMAMNKAMRSRFREAAAEQSPIPGRSTGWIKSRKRRGVEGKFTGLTISEGHDPLKDGGSGSWAEGWTGEASRVVPSTALSGEKSFDRTILELSRNMQWSHIIRVWQEIEMREKEGIKVSLGPQAYEDLMSALIEHPDVSVVAKCGSVFDHLVSSGKDVKQVLCNLYMKGCSLAKLGTRAVALMESLDQLPGKKFKPNPHFFYNLLTATSAEGLVKESKLYYGLMRDMGFVANNRVFHHLTDMYIEAGEIFDALMVFEHMHQAGHKSRDALVNKLVYTCVRHGDPEVMHKALDLLQITGNSVLPLTVQNVLYMATRKRDSDLATKMWVAAQGWGHTFSDVDYSFTVQAFMSAGKDEMGLATLVQAYKEGRKVSRKTLTFCAQRLSISNNRLDGAYYTLASLKQNGEPVPVEAVNAVIVGCAIRQGVDRCFSTAEALPVVFELQPNLDTYNALMHVLGSMRKQEAENASLGIGMSLLDKMESEGVKPDQETFISLIDLACMSEGFSEAIADNLVERMTNRYDLRLDQDIVDTLASAFHAMGQKDVAQAWAAKLPPLDGESTSLSTTPDDALPRPRRSAEERGRYTGFDGRPFSRGSGFGNQRHHGRGGSRGGDRPQRDRRSSERFSRGGVRGHFEEEGIGGSGYSGGVVAVPEEGGGDTASPGWSDKYTRR